MNTETCENPTPTKTWSECIRCPECETAQWAMLEHEHNMPFAMYVHDCQNCGYTILESEWEMAYAYFSETPAPIGGAREDEGI